MGAIGPKNRTSKAKKNTRRAASWKISTPTLVKCSKCGELMAAHRVCKACGSYKKQAVLKVD